MIGNAWIVFYFEMFESFNGQWKVHDIGWSPEKAAEVLNAWQKKFSNEVFFNRFSNHLYKLPRFLFSNHFFFV